MAGEEVYLRLLLVVVAVSVSSQAASNDQRRGLTLQAGLPPLVVAQRSAPLRLNCSLPRGLKAQPLEFRWRKDGSVVAARLGSDKRASPGRVQVQADGALYFKRFVHRVGGRKKKPFSHQGTYDCLVRTEKGMFVARRVRVQAANIARNFSQEPESVEAVEGGVARFQCSIPAVPPARISWEHNHSSLSPDSSPSSRYTLHPPGVLVIRDVRREDAGEYRCLAEPVPVPGQPLDRQAARMAQDTRRSRPALLAVLPAGGSRPTRMLGLPQNLTLELGSSGVLECLADGFPPPSVSWNRTLPSSSGGGGQQQLEPGRMREGGSLLSFYKVQPQDAGVYLCTVTRPGASPLHYSASLTVLEPPRLPDETPSFQRWPVTRTVQFPCDVTGVPPPQVTWLHNGSSPLHRRQRIEIRKEDHRLVVHSAELSDTGYYQCIAENSAGMVNLLGYLVIYQKDGVPKAPVNLTGKALSADSVQLSWDRPWLDDSGTAPLVTTLISYSKEDETPVTEFEGRSEPHVTRTLTNLEPSTNYTFYVRFYNEVGASEASNKVTVLTWEKLGPVRELQVHPLNASAVQLSWAPGPGQKPPLTYLVSLLAGEGGDWGDRAPLHTLSVQHPHTEAVFAGLENTTSYVAEVVAQMEDKTAPPAVVSFTTSSLPPPADVTATPLSPRGVRVSWEGVGAPLLPALYQLCYTPTAHTTTAPATQHCLNSTESEVEVGGLAPYTSYSFTVLVHARGLSSPPSRPVQATTAQDVPGPPANLTGRVVAPGTVELEWSPPLAPRGLVTGFLLSLHPHRGQPPSTWRNISLEGGDRRSARVEELTGAPIYSFVLHAVTSAGVGAPSPTLELELTPCPGPGPPAPVCPPQEGPKVVGPERMTGIIVGAVAGLVVVLLCILVFAYVKKRGGCSRRRPQSFHGNGHAVGAGSGNGHVTGGGGAGSGGEGGDIPLQEVECLAPMLTQLLPENEQSDAKGGGHMIVTANGVRVNGLLRNFQNGQISNGHVVSFPEGHPAFSQEETQRLIDSMMASTDGSHLLDDVSAPPPHLGGPRSPLDPLEEIDDDPEEEEEEEEEPEERGHSRPSDVGGGAGGGGAGGARLGEDVRWGAGAGVEPGRQRLPPPSPPSSPPSSSSVEQPPPSGSSSSRPPSDVTPPSRSGGGPLSTSTAAAAPQHTARSSAPPSQQAPPPRGVAATAPPPQQGVAPPASTSTPSPHSSSSSSSSSSLPLAAEGSQGGSREQTELRPAAPPASNAKDGGVVGRGAGGGGAGGGGAGGGATDLEQGTAAASVVGVADTKVGVAYPGVGVADAGVGVADANVGVANARVGVARGGDLDGPSSSRSVSSGGVGEGSGREPDHVSREEEEEEEEEEGNAGDSRTGAAAVCGVTSSSPAQDRPQDRTATSTSPSSSSSTPNLPPQQHTRPKSHTKASSSSQEPGLPSSLQRQQQGGAVGRHEPDISSQTPIPQARLLQPGRGGSSHAPTASVAMATAVPHSSTSTAAIV